MQYVLLGVMICNYFHAVKSQEAYSTLLNPPPPPINDITTAPMSEDFISDLPGPIAVGSDDRSPAVKLPSPPSPFIAQSMAVVGPTDNNSPAVNLPSPSPSPQANINTVSPQAQVSPTIQVGTIDDSSPTVVLPSPIPNPNSLQAPSQNAYAIACQTDERSPAVVLPSPIPNPNSLQGPLPTFSAIVSNNDNAQTATPFADTQLEQGLKVDGLYEGKTDSTKPFFTSIEFESKLSAIPPRQVTPSKDDTTGCKQYWNVWPDGYNGSQITHCYPLSAVGQLKIYFEDLNEPIPCSGALIGPSTVLTAAHCFTNTQELLKKKFTSVDFTPGQFGNYKPFGTFKNGAAFTPGEKFNSSQDYAVVKFEEDIGSIAGWLGVYYNGCGSKKYDITLAGYSEDRQRDEMWTSQCDNTEINSCSNGELSGVFLHECDTNPGTSGAPLYENNIIVGVHSGADWNARLNIATYISRQLLDFISTHIN